MHLLSSSASFPSPGLRLLHDPLGQRCAAHHVAYRPLRECMLCHSLQVIHPGPVVHDHSLAAAIESPRFAANTTDHPRSFKHTRVVHDEHIGADESTEITHR